MAGSIPESTLEEIKARTDLADLIASYGVQVRRAGASYKACCPFHHEKTPSFNIQPAKGFYHCFGCGESGDAFKFVMKQEGLTFVEAAKKLAQRCGVTIEEKEDPQAGLRKRLYALLAELSAFYRRCLIQTKAAEPARRYLASRAIPDDIAEAFAIGYAPEGSDPILKWAEKHGVAEEDLYAAGVLMRPRYAGDRPYHPFGGRLMFTIRDRAGRVVAFSGRVLEKEKSPRKYVNSPETPVFRKSSVLFAFDRAAAEIVKAPRREAIVCEGQIDVIRCHACGFRTAVASQGTAFTAEHVSLLKKCADSVVLVFDADGAGRKAAIRTGGEFLAAGVPVRVATLPAGEDPDSLLRDKGPDAFRACLDAAESITAFQVRVLREAEAAPDTIDAVSRVSRATLETIALCPSAVLRASLMAEAAEGLKLPVSALEEDFANLKKPAVARPKAAPEVPSPDPRDSDAEEVSSGEDPEADFDAAAPVNNPPPAREGALCAFLLAHEHDATLAELLAAYAPAEVFQHPFTARFVAAWCAEVTSANDEIARFRSTLGAVETKWLDKMLLEADRNGMSELVPADILKDFLRHLWTDAAKRALGALGAESTPENDRKRLERAALVRTFSRGKWESAAEKMNVAALA